MCPSTESTDAQCEFAADVLRNLLRHIEAENNTGARSLPSLTCLDRGTDDVPGVYGPAIGQNVGLGP
jgi:hypothetical protein